MSIKLIPSILVGVAIGFGLGCVPVVNEHLHWNLWYIVPISGLILGVVIAWIQFTICYRINQKVAGVSLVILAAAAMIAYASVDYGIYFTMKVTITGVEKIPDGDYRIRDLMTFGRFMKLNLQGSTVSDGPGLSGGTEIGATGATISYIADLLGALLGAGGLLYYFSEKRPYCDRCGKYKEQEDKYQVFFEHEENLVKEIFGRLAELKQKGVYNDMVSYCKELAEQRQGADGDVKIVVEQRLCPDCREATILGNVFRHGKKEWNEIGELGFSLNSEHHEEAPFGRYMA